jgi:hypothetical protein
MTNLAKRDVDSVRRQVEAWLKTREEGYSLAIDRNDSPDFEFIFLAFHGGKPFYVGLSSGLGVLQVFTDVQFREEEQEALKKKFPTPREYYSFLRGLYKELMELGCSYLPRFRQGMDMEGYQVVSTLYPFESGGLNRKDFETTVLSVISATLRGVFYVQDILGIEPRRLPSDEGGRPKFWDPMVS